LGDPQSEISCVAPWRKTINYRFELIEIEQFAKNNELAGIYTFLLKEDLIMDDKKMLDRIILNPKIMVGKPVIRGTRLTVDFILNLLAHHCCPFFLHQQTKYR
jgi:hypothetical protein